MIQKECIVIVTLAFIWPSYSTTTLALCQRFNTMRPQSLHTAIIEEWGNPPNALLSSEVARFNLWIQLKRLTWYYTIILHWGYHLLSFLQDINPASNITDPHKLARDGCSSLDFASVSSIWWKKSTSVHHSDHASQLMNLEVSKTKDSFMQRDYVANKVTWSFRILSFHVYSADVFICMT